MNFRGSSETMLNTIKRIQMSLEALESVEIGAFEREKTAIIVVDMIKGFALSGALASERVEGLIEPIEALLKSANGMKKVFLCDRHLETAAEFGAYLPHAVEGTDEVMIVDQLYALQDELTSVIFKNSTNGMMAPGMSDYIKAHESQIDNYIVVGDCTDICVLQFALSLKTYFNERNLIKEVIVPASMVETFDLEVTNHDAELMNLFSLYNMQMNGIRVVKHITK